MCYKFQQKHKLIPKLREANFINFHFSDVFLPPLSHLLDKGKLSQIAGLKEEYEDMNKDNFLSLTNPLMGQVFHWEKKSFL